MFALVDAENFHVSCERVFDPALRQSPVIVLSSNDGCAISRSPEAKALGIRMGTPGWHLTPAQRRAVRVRSGQMELYGDMNRRFRTICADFASRVEPYSIDECFLDVTRVPDHPRHATALRAALHRQPGIPVRVGIGPTKTLAKLANHLARQETSGTCCLTATPDPARLASVAVGDVWGVGPRLRDRLIARGLSTAAALAALDPAEARRIGTVTLARTAQELRGTVCHPLITVPPPRRQIAVTRAAGQPLTTRAALTAALAAALAAQAAQAGQRLRRQGLRAGTVTVFFTTSPFRAGPPCARSHTASLCPPTDCEIALTRAALHGLRTSGPGEGRFRFARSGVILRRLVPARASPAPLVPGPARPDTAALMPTLDALRTRFGPDIIRTAAAAGDHTGIPRRAHRSPCWTTRIPAFPRAGAGVFVAPAPP